jgi:hypothetical protein
MNDNGVNARRKILALASIVETATGVALIFDPRLVVWLLVGSNAPSSDILMARLPGIAILGLGLACWPDADRSADNASACRGMLVYNVLIALFLVYLFVVGHLGGVLLWPAVVLHAIVAILLLWTARASPRATSLS